MSNIVIEIKDIKGIVSASLELPLDNGVYALVGGNGTGKSTVLQAFAQLIRPQNALFALKQNDFDTSSSTAFSYQGNSDFWRYNGFWKNHIKQETWRQNTKSNIQVNGMYEGSLFVGTRFQDSKQVDDLLSSITFLN